MRVPRLPFVPLLTGAALLIVGVPRRAEAQPAPTANEQEAAMLFEEGRALVQANRLEEGCAKLAESERLDPTPGTLMNLAHCFVRRKLYASAYVAYREAAMAARRGGREQWALDADKSAKECVGAFATLKIRTDPANATDKLVVLRDGEIVAPAVLAGEPFPIDEGPHRIEARLPGHRTWGIVKMVPEGPAELEVFIPPLEVPPEMTASTEPPSSPHPISSAATARGSSTLRFGSYAVGATGFASLAIGTGFGIRSLLENHVATTRCPAAGACSDAAGVQAYNDGHSAGNASTIALSVGTALVATGLVLYLVAPHRGAGDALSLGHGATLGVSVAPSGVLAYGAF